MKVINPTRPIRLDKYIVPTLILHCKSVSADVFGKHPSNNEFANGFFHIEAELPAYNRYVGNKARPKTQQKNQNSQH